MRRLRVLIVALLAALIVPACSQRIDVVTFEPGGYVELGMQDPGVVPTTLDVTNRSGRSLTVAGVSASCTCAGVELDGTGPWPDGQTRRCTVRIRATPGKRSVATVRIDFAERPPALAVVAVAGKSLVGVSSLSNLDLGRVEAGKPLRFDVTIEFGKEAASLFRDEASTKISWITSEASPIRPVSTTPDRLTPDDLPAKVVGEFDLTTLFSGFGTMTIRARIGHLQLPVVVTWEAFEPLHVSPRVPTLRRDGELMRASITCSGGPGEELIGAVADDPDVAIDFRRGDRGTATLEIAAPASWAAKSGVGSVRIGIRSKDGTDRTVAVPIVCGL